MSSLKPQVATHGIIQSLLPLCGPPTSGKSGGKEGKGKGERDDRAAGSLRTENRIT